MQIKYKPGTKVKLVNGEEVYINYINLYESSYTYGVWFGENRFVNVEEWQISEEIGEKSSIGFRVEYQNQ